MLYSRLRPVLTITAPSGGVILTDPARLTNCRPRALTQCTWTTGAQTTATTMTIRAVIPTAQRPRVVAILGTSLPAGLAFKVQALVGATYTDISAPSSGTIFQLPNGKRILAVVLPSSVSATTGIQIVLSNDVGGTAVLSAADLFTLGELWIGGGIELDIEPDWSIVWEDSTTNAWSPDQQPWSHTGVARRVLTFTPRTMEQVEQFGTDADASALDVGYEYAAMLGAQAIVCIPRYADEAYSQRLLARNLIFGMAASGQGYKHAAGLLYTQTAIKVSEAAM